MSEFVGSYTFNNGDCFTVWKGKKQFKSRIGLLCGIKKHKGTEEAFKEIHDTDFGKICLRSMKLIAKNQEPGYKLVLREFEGVKIPFKVRDDEDEIREWEQTPEFHKSVKSIVGNIIMERPSMSIGDVRSPFKPEANPIQAPYVNKLSHMEGQIELWKN